jgi:hypothetical protein
MKNQLVYGIYLHAQKPPEFNFYSEFIWQAINKYPFIFVRLLYMQLFGFT